MGGSGGEPSGCRWFGAGLQILLSAALPFFSERGLTYQWESAMSSISTPKQSHHTPIAADHQPFSRLAEELRSDTSMEFLAYTLDIA
jgi:hypothetical protein